MLRPLFLLTLALYSWSALELHEWMHVPEVVIHLVQHHSDLGHHDDPEHHGEEKDHEHDHDPFGKTCRDEFCACNATALIATRPQVTFTAVLGRVLTMEAAAVNTRIASFSGSKWNPPRLA